MDERLLQDLSRRELCDALLIIALGEHNIGYEEKDFDVIVDELVYRREHHIIEVQQA